jgi:hypothetical protein
LWNQINLIAEKLAFWAGTSRDAETVRLEDVPDFVLELTALATVAHSGSVTSDAGAAKSALDGKQVSNQAGSNS